MVIQKTGKLYTSDEIYHDLHEKIENLFYMPGEKLSENELCTAYGGVSRHMVRGALARLKEDNFIDVFPQRGTFVSLIDLNYIDDVLYLREALEQETMRRILQREDNTELVEKLHASVVKQKENLTSGAHSFYQQDDEFHEILLESIGRFSVLELYGKHYAHIRRWRNLEVRTQNRRNELPGEHERIIELIEQRDGKALQEFIHYHIDSIGRYSEVMREKMPEYFAK